MLNRIKNENIDQIFWCFLYFNIRIYIPKLEQTNQKKDLHDFTFYNYGYLASKNKKEFYEIIRESSKTALENYAVYKCKEQVKPLQSANPPLQKPPHKFPFRDDLFSLSCIKLIT